MVTMTPSQQEQALQPAYEISDADRQRVERIQKAWQAYNGELDKPLSTVPGQPDDNVMTNRCQPIVDRGIDFLFGKELEISVGENDPQEAQDFLNECWGRRETRIPLLQKYGMNGGLAGQAFLRIVPNPDGSFRLVVVDPSTVFVRTAPQDCETVLLYCIEYCCDEKDNMGKPQRVYYHEEITRIDPDQDDTAQYEDVNIEGLEADVTWLVQHWTRIGDRGKWTPVGAPYSWPYPFAPIFSNQNLPKPNDFWGMADITPDLIGVNQALNLVQSSINRVNKLYGHPILFSYGTGMQPLNISPGRIIEMSTADARIEAVPITSDIANALSFAANLRSDIDEQSSVPGVATGRIADLPRGQISGVALELLFMPLLKKTEKKRCLYGDTIINVSKALLQLKGMSPDIEITLNWQSPLPTDDLQAVQAAIAKQGIGISNATLMRELGYDPEDEQKQSQAEDAQKMAMLPPEMQQQAQAPQDQQSQDQQPFGGEQ